jgi:hypothetical protein
MIDIAAIEGPNGELELHAPDCVCVQLARAAGEPIITMFDCERIPAGGVVPVAECLRSGVRGTGSQPARHDGPPPAPYI